MTIPVLSRCNYLTFVQETGDAWRNEDHNASKFVKAVKGDELNGYAYVPVAGEQRRLSNSNRDEVYGWWAVWAADQIQSCCSEGGILLVPVPGHADTVGKAATTGAPARLAEALAAALRERAGVYDVLRWDQVMVPARKRKGPRDAEVLLSHLRLDGEVPGRPVVLVDDVCTTRGHLRACATALAERGVEVVLAMCAGRTTWEQTADPFEVEPENLGDLEYDVPGYETYYVLSNAMPHRAPGFVGFGSLWMRQQARGLWTGLIKRLRREHGYDGPIIWDSVNDRSAAFFLGLIDAVFKRRWLCWHGILAPEEAFAAEINTRGRAPLDLFVMLVEGKVRFFARDQASKVYHLRYRTPNGDKSAAELAARLGRVERIATVDDAPDSKLAVWGLETAGLFLDAVLASWADVSPTPSQAKVQARLAEHLEWPDLKADTHMNVWKFNIWTWFNPRRMPRPMATRPVPLEFRHR